MSYSNDAFMNEDQNCNILNYIMNIMNISSLAGNFILITEYPLFFIKIVFSFSYSRLIYTFPLYLILNAPPNFHRIFITTVLVQEQ